MPIIWRHARFPRRPVIETVTASELHIATKDGEAMFFHDTLDFSAYANDFYFEFIDSDDKVATAYAGSAGGGADGDPSSPKLGGELIDNGNMEDGDPPTGWTSVNDTISSAADERTGGEGTKSLEFERKVSADRARYSKTFSEGRLYKYSVWLKNLGPANRVQLELEQLGVMVEEVERQTDNTWGLFESTINMWFPADTIRLFLSGTGIARVDDLSFQLYEDVPTTGLRLRNLSNVRNMQSVESGFNPNTVTKIRIWRL